MIFPKWQKEFLSPQVKSFVSDVQKQQLFILCARCHVYSQQMYRCLLQGLDWKVTTLIHHTYIKWQCCMTFYFYKLFKDNKYLNVFTVLFLNTSLVTWKIKDTHLWKMNLRLWNAECCDYWYLYDRWCLYKCMIGQAIKAF